MYRHPNAQLDTTLNFLYKVTEKINKENKYCLLMGDFNTNLLNTLGAYAFHPQILKPSRITDHSATLIDNIFLTLLNTKVRVAMFSLG